MTNSVHEFDRYAAAQSALVDPYLVPPPPAESGPPGSMAWLRASVARFSTGEAHARRRALVEADLVRLDMAALRQAAESGPEDDARLLVVRALAEGLGLPEPDAIAQAVTVVAGAYFGGDDADADAAVAWLLPRAGRLAEPGEDLLEVAANRIGLLVQACDATGGLIENSRHAADGCPVGYRFLRAALRRYAAPAPQRLGPRLGSGPRRAGLPRDRYDEPRGGCIGRLTRRYGGDQGTRPSC